MILLAMAVIRRHFYSFGEYAFLPLLWSQAGGLPTINPSFCEGSFIRHKFYFYFQLLPNKRPSPIIRTRLTNNNPLLFNCRFWLCMFVWLIYIKSQKLRQIFADKRKHSNKPLRIGIANFSVLFCCRYPRAVAAKIIWQIKNIFPKCISRLWRDQRGRPLQEYLRIT